MKTKHLLLLLLLAVLVPWAANAQANSCVIESFPWTEDFNSYYNGYFDPQDGPCWSYASLNDVNRHFQIENGALYLPHGTANLHNGTYASLRLPQLSLPSENYAFSLSIYREAETNGYVEVFASPNGNIGSLEPIGYIYTKYNFDGAYWDNHTHGSVPPENGAGWYTYSFNIPYSGSCYIILRCMTDWYNQGYTPKNIYMDNFCIREVPTGLTVSNITSTSANISWTPATDETEWIVQYGTHNAFYNGTFQQVTVTGTPSLALTSLDPLQRYHVRVKAVYGSEKSGWSLPSSFEMLPRYTVGHVDDTHRVIPTCSLDSYYFTQQIYTADELGEACTIRSIEFFMSSETPCTRNLDVYLVPTNKVSFESTSDWISVTSANRVFSGTVNFSKNDWTVIKLQSSFDYDGQSNLALIVDDNTGFDQPYSYFNVMSTTTHQGNLCSSNQTNINPSSPGNGYLISIKNQLRLFKEYPLPSNLHCTTTTATTATVDWTENGTSDTWQICINDDETNLVTVNSSNKPYTLTGLTPDTQYSVKVRSQHENSLYSSWSNSFYFGTAASLPYSTGFETECDWTLVNGNCANQWFWGTAAHNGEGTLGLYISNDGGTTNAYNSERSATVYAYKTFDLEAGNYELSYDWLANGQMYHDFMRVALVPATVSLEASTLLPEGFDYDALPEGWIALDGCSQLNKVTEWQTASHDFEVPAAGFYNLVFAWRNNFFSGTNPPAAIDNVSVETTTCLPPGNLTVDNVGTTSADLSWAAWPEVESYTVKYLNTGFIFTEGFENGLGDWTLYNCADATDVSSLNAHSGNASFLFFYNTNPPQYLISPELIGVDEGMKLEFYYRNQSTEYPETFHIGFSSTDNATESFTFGDEITASDAQWHLYNEMIPIGTKYICWKLTSYDQEFLFIDDIVVGIDAPAFEWQTAAVAGNATEASTTLTNLMPGFQYEAYVYPDCAPYKVSETVYFLTEPAVMPQPFYATKFENGCDWILVNGSLTNAWTWGTAAHNGNGTHGLYISNDGGTTNAYSNTSSTMVYAYKTFNFEAGVYSFSYDWMVYGEKNYDFVRVALVPDTVSLEVGTTLPSGFTYNALPDGWIALDGGRQLPQTTNWKTVSHEIEVATTGIYKMVFAWRNDDNGGANPPAAIDNVIIDVVTCPTPVNLMVNNVGATTSELGWTAAMPTDSYTVKYRTSPTAILNEGFENGIDNWTLRNCHYSTGISTSNVHSGNASFYFYFSTNPPQYLISPELTGVVEGMTLKFYYKNFNTNYPETFQVGFSTTDNETASFTFGDEITASDVQWHLYSEAIPVGTKYICWKLNSYDQDFLFLDDILVSAEGSASEWMTTSVAGNATEVIATLTSLSTETEYEAFVYPDCDPDKVSDTVSFTTEESCPTPRELNANNVKHNRARLSWSGISEVNSYTLKYRTAQSINSVYSEGFEGGTMPSGWTQSGPNTWVVSAGFGYNGIGAHSGTFNARINHRNTNEETFLITPMLDLSGQNDLYLSFWYMNYIWTSDIDQIFVYYRVNEGDWVELWNTTEDHQIWTESGAIALPNPSANYQIGFKMIDKWGHGVGIDDITIGSIVPAGEWQTVNVEGNAFQVHATLTDLTPSTPYEAYVYPYCDPDKVSEVYFKTKEAPLSYYATDFETECDWTLVNGELTNQWCWGTAMSNGEGPHGLYISNDGGSTNAYDNTSNTMVYAYKTFNFAASHYNFTYDWNAYGEYQYDFLRVALVPASVSLEAGPSMPSDFNYNTLPEGWIALDGGSQLNRAIGWNTMSQEIEIATAGHYNVVFAWRNDYSTGTNPPAAIDNVSIEAITCLTPANLTVSDIGATNAIVNWTGELEVDSYTVKYIPLGIVFAEGFENGIGDWTLRNCSANSGISFEAAHSGLAAFRFCYNSNPPQFLISPELTGITEGMQLEFYYVNASTSWTETFQVGFSATDNEIASFTFGDEITASDGQWHLYSEPIPAGTKFICWKLTSYDKWYLYIDDIVIGPGDNADGWQTITVAGNANEVNATLTGLMPETNYVAYVYPDCDPDRVTETVSFTTLEPTTVTQTISLSEGENWVSFFVETTLNDLKTALVSASNNASGIKITSQNNGFTSWNGSSWKGSLSPFDVRQMYVIEVPAACDFTLEAMPINPAAYPITIVNGINWIGFPFSASMSVTEAFNGFAVNGDKVISLTDGSANYQGSWSGGVTTLQPGKGYKFVSTTTAPRTFVFPSNAKTTKPVVEPTGK